jgi:hypothetical protein
MVNNISEEYNTPLNASMTMIEKSNVHGQKCIQKKSEYVMIDNPV